MTRKLFLIGEGETDTLFALTNFKGALDLTLVAVTTLSTSHSNMTKIIQKVIKKVM